MNDTNAASSPNDEREKQKHDQEQTQYVEFLKWKAALLGSPMTNALSTKDAGRYIDLSIKRKLRQIDSAEQDELSMLEEIRHAYFASESRTVDELEAEWRFLVKVDDIVNGVKE